MFWSSKPKSLLEPDHEAWQIACWRWLSRELSDTYPLSQAPLILPTFVYFPASEATGADLVRHLFKHVAQWMRVDPAAYDLVPHRDIPEGVHNAHYAAGTYSQSTGARPMISYLPSLAEEPLELIPVLAHEICHDVVRRLNSPPPGGWELEEPAVDLMTVYFGFGVFCANRAFRFSYGDGGFGTWRVQTSGYLSQEHWAFALAVFLRLRGEGPEAAFDWLQPQLKKMLKKASAYLDANHEMLDVVRP